MIECILKCGQVGSKGGIQHEEKITNAYTSRGKREFYRTNHSWEDNIKGCQGMGHEKVDLI
jgi:hypothetical protein